MQIVVESYYVPSNFNEKHTNITYNATHYLEIPDINKYIIIFISRFIDRQKLVEEVNRYVIPDDFLTGIQKIILENESEFTENIKTNIHKLISKDKSMELFEVFRSICEDKKMSTIILNALTLSPTEKDFFKELCKEINKISTFNAKKDETKIQNINDNIVIDGKTYKIKSAIYHSGTTTGGHYYMYTKRVDNKWYKYNDSTVTLADQNDENIGKSYVFLYERVK